MWNKYQSNEEELNIENLPDEVREEFYECLNIPFIKWLISPDRPRACDLPRDEKGRIIVDVTKPHILEDMDYFRPTAIHYQKTGKLTDLKPNGNPNSEFGKWILEEVRRCRDGYVRESDGEWVTGDMYFFLNYYPIEQTKTTVGSRKGDRIVDFPEVWDGIYLRYHYMDQARNGGMFDWSGGLNGAEISSRGKAHPYSQKVYTPSGCKSWGEIKIGDKLFGDDGKTTTVINIPFDDYVDIYKISLKDGREVYASGNHLWKVVKRHSNKKGNIIASTFDMMDKLYFNREKTYRNPSGKEFIWAIPRNFGVDWEYKNTKIDPYTLGLCLGDGSFRTPKAQNFIYYTSREDDMLVYRNIVPYNIRKMQGKMKYHIDFPGIGNILKEYGLYMKKSEDKFIPDEYLYNSRDVRINILRGIMDSDGHVESSGVPMICTSSQRLCENIVFLARSLGYNCLYNKQRAGYKINGEYKQCLDSYKIRIFTNDRIFNLERKQRLVSKFSSKYSMSNVEYSTIVNIEYSHRERAKCVTVDNESNCYLIGDFVTTHNSKSLTMASKMTKYFTLGESSEVNKRVKVVATAYTKEYLNGNDGILTKFQNGLDFIATDTQFPHLLLKNSLQDMTWQMGWKDLDTGARMGTLNQASGVAIKDDISKIRGKRQNFIVCEEFGSFAGITQLYNIMLPCVREGNYSFGQIYLVGTAGDKQSDFQQATELIYNPKGYYLYALPNVYDKPGDGRKFITFFYPEYLNRKGLYDENGNSDVTAALVEILLDRYRVKYNTTDLATITKNIAERPITPQEAIMRAKGNKFPVNDLNQRLNELDNNPHEFDDVFVGELTETASGEVEFKPTDATPIRIYPIEDNMTNGALEIFCMPQKDSNGRVPSGRYIASSDPIDQDNTTDSTSLYSTFVLDLFTDNIVAEYTGRKEYAEQNYEVSRLLCKFFNAKLLYENNLKGTYAYFSKVGCVNMLADTPEYLQDKELLRIGTIGNTMKGVRATKPINNYADDLTKEWLIQPETVVIKNEEGKEVEVTRKKLFSLRNRALIMELIKYNSFENFDRIRAFGMLMLYREQFRIAAGGDIQEQKEIDWSETLNFDPFFTRIFNRGRQ